MRSELGQSPSTIFSTDPFEGESVNPECKKLAAADSEPIYEVKTSTFDVQYVDLMSNH